MEETYSTNANSPLPIAGLACHSLTIDEKVDMGRIEIHSDLKIVWRAFVGHDPKEGHIRNAGWLQVWQLLYRRLNQGPREKYFVD
jgi:hypothetical protein